MGTEAELIYPELIICFYQMTCSMFGVPWANCHCTANLHGSEEESLWQQCTAHSDSAQIVERLGKGKQESVAPYQYSTLYPEIDDHPSQVVDNK